MISREDLESFLIRTEMDHREIGESMWLVDPVKDAQEDHPAVVVSLSPPLVIFRASIGAVPEGDHARLQLFQKLLELNASDLVHGAYGLEGDEIILVDALELQDLDYSEFLASLESLSLAVTSHAQHLALD
ncbi:MAG: hypothetical protein Q8W45_09290 [Candidatus Palauibacterales bacterium]|jgi:CesT_Tir_1|nr:hypothetical protein [Candidatus Palauibacterales bacterium]MDP2483463.1 hypothetical protein [Candidatus Palauibacterales bacterium]